MGSFVQVSFTLFSSSDGKGPRKSLASHVNNLILNEVNPTYNALVPRKPKSHSSHDSMNVLSKSVSAKLEEGDFKGAFGLLAREDSLASFNEATLNNLRDEHPSFHPASLITPPQVLTQTLHTSL